MDRARESWTFWTVASLTLAAAFFHSKLVFYKKCISSISYLSLISFRCLFSFVTKAEALLRASVAASSRASLHLLPPFPSASLLSFPLLTSASPRHRCDGVGVSISWSIIILSFQCIVNHVVVHLRDFVRHHLVWRRCIPDQSTAVRHRSSIITSWF